MIRPYIGKLRAFIKNIIFALNDLLIYTHNGG